MTHLTIPHPLAARRTAHFHAPAPPPAGPAEENRDSPPEATGPEESLSIEPSRVNYEPVETPRRRPTRNYTAGCLFLAGGAVAIAALIFLVVLVGLFVSDFEINEEEASSEQEVRFDEEDDTVTYELAQPYSGRGFQVQFPGDWIALEDEPGENTVIFLSPAALEQTPFDESVSGGLDEAVFDHPETIQVRHRELQTSAQAYIENRVQGPGAEGMNYGEIQTRVLAGKPVAWSRAVGLETPDDAHQVLLAVEVGERLFIFTGYDTPDNADELVTLMLEMVQSLALL